MEVKTAEPLPRSVAPPEGLAPSAELAPHLAAFAAEVKAGLGRSGQKELPSKYLYDAIGTALFEVITLLPEYGLTRADERILTAHAGDIVGRMKTPLRVAELGSGSARKTHWLLQALAGRERVVYFPIDISASALLKCRQELAFSEAGRGIAVVGLEHTYIDGLRQATRRRPAGTALLVLFLGSTIGNFERPAAEQFLRTIRDLLRPGDALLLGTDLVKPVRDLLLAYDDPAGVTAAFNLNLLARINRELGGDIEVRGFEHQAIWNARQRRIEMHLRARRAQRFQVAAAGLRVEMQAGETIWTEACQKFTAREVVALALRAGFQCAGQWIDREWPFAESLLVAR